MTDEFSPAVLQQTLRSVMDSKQRWLPTLQFDPAQRWYRTWFCPLTGAEIRLMTWLPGQSTLLHDHGGSSGAIIVVSGVLTERVVSSGETPELIDTEYQAESITSFGPTDIHDIINATTEPAISAHVYAPTLTTIQRYRWTQQGAVPFRVDDVRALA